jgi:chemotaxis protein histidine kinase CheA
MVVRGEVLPVVAAVPLLGWPQNQPPEYGVLMQAAERLSSSPIDSFAGREDAVIKSLEDFRPKGVAGVTTLSNGQIVLILDMKELLSRPAGRWRRARQQHASPGIFLIINGFNGLTRGLCPLFCVYAPQQ